MSKEEPKVKRNHLESLLDVDVFRTNVKSEALALQILEELSKRFPGIKANFDLEDVDNILRIEKHSHFSIQCIMDCVNELGVTLELLPD